MTQKTKQISIDLVKPNPENPRVIKDSKYQKLLQSLKDFPEMAGVRPLVLNKEHVVLGGNQRLKAMQEAGWTHVPVIIVDWSEEKQREFIVKDNANFGEWDWEELSNFAAVDLLSDWGVDLPAVNFEPNVNPNFDTRPVTEEDMEQTSESMGVQATIAKTVDVICPDCGHEFQIKN